MPRAVVIDSTRTPTGVSRSAGIVLVVDEVDSTLRRLEQLLLTDGYIVLTAADGRHALRIVHEAQPDMIVMDVATPQAEGFATCAALKQQPETRLIPIVLMTGSIERADRVRAIEAGADDVLAKPVDESELRARVKSLIRLRRYTAELDSAEAVILSLARTVEARDPCTVGHCERLAAYASALGNRLGLPEEDVAALHRGGYLHDIGKVAIPDAILTKAGPLTDDEFERMKQHVVVGERLCGKLRVLSRVRPIIRHHHERLDGSGYPDGLRGDQIPRLAQIIGIVDVYDALTTWRPYKLPLPIGTAIEILRQEAAQGWRDRALVDEFVDLVRSGGVPAPPRY